MPCTPPGSTSPGFLRLEYTHLTQGLQHGSRARLLSGVDPLNATLMGATANDWADAMAGVMTANFRISGFSVLRPDGTLMYNGPLQSIVPGAHTAAANSQDSRSTTVAFTGHGIPLGVLDCAGEETCRVFCGGAYEWVPGQQFIAAGLDVQADAHAAFLRASLVIWADYYGRKASVRPLYPTQKNAFAQNHWGE